MRVYGDVTSGECGPISLNLEAVMTDEAPLEVPWSALSAEALRRVLEAFVLREGTDYGELEFSLEQKVEQVMYQLKRGEAALWFDPETNSVTLAPATRSGRLR